MPEDSNESIEMDKINISIPKDYRNKLGEMVKLLGYTSLAELIRDALREKMRREAPQLLNLLKEEEILVKS